MRPDRLNDVNIVSETVLPTPEKMRQALPLTPKGRSAVYAFRQQVARILDGEDSRLLAIVGPCSIHDIPSALQYARRLKALSRQVDDVFMLVMRVYFEKPRTTLGWKGFINDPRLDDSFRMDEGLYKAREFLLQLCRMGMPAATEALDSITPQYIGDLICWTAIGARTTASQTHREMASGLSTPVGFKNGIDGSIDVAVNALVSARQPHHFLGITGRGQSAIFHTRGNRYGHIVLRGGLEPNYDARSVARCEHALTAAGLPARLIVDCSHGNSQRRPARQPAVLADVVRQIAAGNLSIAGFMVESNLNGGQQPLAANPRLLKRGVSITDACVDWTTTERMITTACRRLRPLLAGRKD